MTVKILTGATFAAELQRSIYQAKREVDIVQYSWSFSKLERCNELLKLEIALRYAIKNGVQVNCIIGNEQAREYLRSVGINARNLPKYKLIHAKFTLIDGKLLFIGSHNLTKNAMLHNLEMTAMLELDERNNEACAIWSRMWAVASTAGQS